ncbi:MAG: threonine--tRNA ligase [Methanobrevibacter sp.]|jgi:threonyl-tRNA synthetase|nr:threonine--tRNA ligase [Candidatus Methanovirga basalitermitum]
MRVLLIHSDYLKYQTKNKTKIAEEIEKTRKNGFFQESLVVFSAVEKEDEKNIENVVENVFNEIKDIYKKVNPNNIVLYPYAHLSSSLSSPKIAIEVLKKIEDKFKKEGYDIHRVPFGWYKSFELSCKGHPLSELSRTLGSKYYSNEESKDLIKEKSQFLILEKNGKLTVPEDYNFSNNDLKNLMEYELGNSQSTGEEPPHVKLMKEKELCDYESAADVGHLKWFPKGKLIRDLISDYVYDLVVENGAMPIETPVMYDLSNDAIREHAEKFGERQYKIQAKKELMLRFACCFGAFKLLTASFLTWKNLPVKIYELSTYSFRFEKRGEVIGLKRLRGFTMPDWHTACTNINQTLKEFENQVNICLQTGIDLNVNYEIIFRASKDFYDKNKEWMYYIANKIKKPIILELIPKRKHYWVCKIDFATIDALGRPIENPTVQIDIESGKRFGISYLGEDEKEHHPIILHCSPTGSIERVICSLLEKIAVEMSERPPMFPVWLSPTQVRIIPIGEKHLEISNKLFNELYEHEIRVDIDDKGDRIGKKIRNASKEWIPYTIVIGDRELETNEFNVFIRSTDEKKNMNMYELIKEIKSHSKDLPFRKLTLSKNLSNRINFQ